MILAFESFDVLWYNLSCYTELPRVLNVCFFFRDTVHKRAVDVVCATYKTLYEAIVDEKNKYPDVKTLVPRTPDQVTSLLT